MPDKNVLDILGWYESCLCDKLYRFTLSSGQEMHIRFFQENFCHLIGLQHVYNGDKHYLGKAGYSKVKSGAITVQSLKKHNQAKYRAFMHDRLLHFHEITKEQFILSPGYKTEYRTITERAVEQIIRHE